MPSLRRQIIQTPAGGLGDGNHTQGRSARFLQAYIGKTFVGGAQSIRWSMTNGVRHQAQIGNDQLETVPGVRDYSGTITRFQVRGKDIMEMFVDMFNSSSDVDFREMPVDVRLYYVYQSITGNTTFEKTYWVLKDVNFSGYDWSADDPTSLLNENVPFIAKAVERVRYNKRRIAPHGYLYAPGMTDSQFNSHNNQVI